MPRRTSDLAAVDVAALERRLRWAHLRSHEAGCGCLRRRRRRHVRRRRLRRPSPLLLARRLRRRGEHGGNRHHSRLRGPREQSPNLQPNRRHSHLRRRRLYSSQHRSLSLNLYSDRRHRSNLPSSRRCRSSLNSSRLYSHRRSIGARHHYRWRQGQAHAHVSRWWSEGDFEIGAGSDSTDETCRWT